MSVFLCLVLPEVHTLEQGLGYLDGHGEPCLHLTAWHPTQSSHQRERDIEPEIPTEPKTPAWARQIQRDFLKTGWFPPLENTSEIKITSIFTWNICFLGDPGKTEVPKLEQDSFPVFLWHKQHKKGTTETQEGNRRTQGAIWPWFWDKQVVESLYCLSFCWCGN